MEERPMEQYLQQILDELRAIRRLLEQGGVSGQASSAEVADQLPLFTTAALDLSVQPADSAKDYLGTFLTEKGLTLIEAEQLPSSSPEKRAKARLAYLIGQNYEVAGRMLDNLRAAIQQSRRIVVISVEHLQAHQRSNLANICQRLTDLRILEDVERIRSEGKLRKIACTVCEQSEAKSYLTGGWFELYVAEEVRRTLAGAAPLVLRSAKLQHHTGSQLEVDVLFVVRRDTSYSIIAIECKVGKNINNTQIREQVGLIASMLNLSPQQVAVVMPNNPSSALKQNCLEQAGAQCIGINGLEAFLKGMIQ